MMAGLQSALVAVAGACWLNVGAATASTNERASMALHDSSMSTATRCAATIIIAALQVMCGAAINVCGSSAEIAFLPIKWKNVFFNFFFFSLMLYATHLHCKCVPLSLRNFYYLFNSVIEFSK